MVSWFGIVCYEKVFHFSNFWSNHHRWRRSIPHQSRLSIKYPSGGSKCCRTRNQFC
ncbi:unnamed protein product [Hymenolepis diminuta]|uniref:Uncharacterized protein n=1 Tax=Hymenolepis diminuta TaxID=6216 RepID=A0A564XYL4_HYMDI|nr:unnamed protein product [Hymenolepis diminuta]